MYRFSSRIHSSLWTNKNRPGTQTTHCYQVLSKERHFTAYPDLSGSTTWSDHPNYSLLVLSGPFQRMTFHSIPRSLSVHNTNRHLNYSLLSGPFQNSPKNDISQHTQISRGTQHEQDTQTTHCYRVLSRTVQRMTFHSITRSLRVHNANRQQHEQTVQTLLTAIGSFPEQPKERHFTA